MANEIQFSYASSKTAYYLVFNRVGQVWNVTNTAFESYVTASYSNYKITATEQGTASGMYFGNFPSAITAGIYSIVAHEQMGGGPLETDPKIALGDYQWNGVATLPLSDLATSGQIGQIAPIRIARGVMIQNFPFKMVSSADHITPFISGTISGQISRDGGLFGPLQSGAFTEVGLGWYKLQALTSGDLLANTVALVFQGAGMSGGLADQRDFAFVTQKTSGY